jgi:penicillin-binding protein 1A
VPGSGDGGGRRPHSGGPRPDQELLLLLRRRRRRRAPRGRIGRRLGIGLLACLVAVVVVAGVTGSVMLNDCSLAALRPISLGENSFLFTTNGSLLGAIPSSTNRQPLRLSEISPWLAKATVAIEDRRFYAHGGLDYQGIVRAAVADLKAGKVVEGGSTITQELVRNLYIGSSQRTLSRKLREACLATKLADKLTKKQILAAYLNEVFYGRHAYGAEAGAETYFSTTAQRLTLEQAALLAGLPQAPSVYDPLAHPDVARRRRDDVLRALFVSGQITRDELAKGLATPLGLKPGHLYSQIRHPNFFGYATQQLVDQYGARRVAAGGLRVRTTVDGRLQLVARQAIASHLRERTDPAAALVAIDPRTGAIKAMVNYLPSGATLQFNLASQGHRTAGSSFKPFVLATAINQGVSVYSTFYGPPSFTITDPQCATNGVLWDVHNYADEAAGTMNLVDATAHSVNTIYAQLSDAVGPANVVPVAHRMGIQSPLQAVCSITLGTQAVTPLEMTDAYATLAARGIHHAPQAVSLVRAPDGKVLGKLKPKGDRALPQNTADLVTYVLQTVVRYGTGYAANLGSRPVAGKTGTAENFQDAWFCGYVPQLATCVWVGYPHLEQPLLNVEGIGGVAGGTIPAEIWHDFMSAAVGNLPVQNFAYPVFTGHTISGPGGYSTYQPSSTSTTTTSTTTTSTTPTRPSKPTPAPAPAPTPAPTPAPPPTTTTSEPPPPPPTTPTDTTGTPPPSPGGPN